MLHNFIFNGSLVSNTKKFSDGGGVGVSDVKTYKIHNTTAIEDKVDAFLHGLKLGDYSNSMGTFTAKLTLEQLNKLIALIIGYDKNDNVYILDSTNNVVFDSKTARNKRKEMFATGGGVGDELMGGQPNKSEKSGYKLLKVQHNGKIIVVTDNNGETKERWIKNENGVAGYSLRYNGNEYEFADSFNYANGGGIESEYRISGIVWYVTEESAGSDYDKIVGNVLTEDEFDEFFNDGKIEETRFNIKAKYDWQIRDKIYAEMAENDEERGLEYEKGRHIIGYKLLVDNQDSGFDSDLPYEADENEGDYEYVNGGVLSSDDKKNISEFIKTIENEVQSKNPIKKSRELFFGDSEVKYKLELKQDEQDENMYSLRLLRFNDELKKYVEEDSMRDSMFIIYAKLEDYRDNFYKYAGGGGVRGGAFNVGDKVMVNDNDYVKYFSGFDLSKPATIISKGKVKSSRGVVYFYGLELADGRKPFNNAPESLLTLVSYANGGGVPEFIGNEFNEEKEIEEIEKKIKSGKFVRYAQKDTDSLGLVKADYDIIRELEDEDKYANGGGLKHFVGKFNEAQLKSGEDKIAIEKAKKETGLKYIESKIIKKNGKPHLMEVYLTNLYSNGGGVAEGWTDDEMSDEKALYAGNKFVKGGGLKQKGKTDKAHDKVYKAKRVGYRYTDERAKKLGLSSNAKPTQEHIDKYLGNGVYKEDRADRSDKSRMKQI